MRFLDICLGLWFDDTLYMEYVCVIVYYVFYVLNVLKNLILHIPHLLLVIHKNKTIRVLVNFLILQ